VPKWKGERKAVNRHDACQLIPSKLSRLATYNEDEGMECTKKLRAGNENPEKSVSIKSRRRSCRQRFQQIRTCST
jgi:hypothetical protein